jgi:hypothetical protein
MLYLLVLTRGLRQPPPEFSVEDVAKPGSAGARRPNNPETIGEPFVPLKHAVRQRKGRSGWRLEEHERVDRHLEPERAGMGVATLQMIAQDGDRVL